MSRPLKEGDDDHIRGFILHKLYLWGMWSRISTGVHHKHTSVDNLPKGYPLKYRRQFPKIIKKMKRRSEQLIIVFSSTGEEHVCANIEQFDRGLELCNKYRESGGLPPLDRQLRAIMD